MKLIMKHDPSFLKLLLLSIFSVAFSNGLSTCDGCVPENLLRSEAYGLDLATDYLYVGLCQLSPSLLTA